MTQGLADARKQDPINRRVFLLRLALIFLFAFALRVLYITRVDNSGIGSWSDQGGDIALNLLQGRGYVTSYYSFDDLRSFRMPGLPLVLYAIWSVFGYSIVIPKLIMAVVSALSCVLIALLGEKLFNQRVAIMAGLGAALCESFVRWTGTLGAETLAIFFLTGGVLLFCTPPPRLSATWKLVPSGIMLGLLALTRPAYLPYAALVTLIFLVARHPKWEARAVMAFAATVIVMLSPWVVRNAIVHQRLVITSTEGGLTFLEANNPVSLRSSGDWVPQFSQTLPALRAQARAFSEVDFDKLMYRKGFEYVRGDLTNYARVFMLRISYLWEPVPHLRGDLSRKHIVVMALWWGNLYALAIVAFVSIRPWKQAEHWPILAAFLWVSIVSGIFWSQVRYRAPLEPFIIMYAAVGLDALLRRRLSTLQARKPHP